MAVKQYALSHIKHRNYIIMISLDVREAFDSAWWPGILNNLRAIKCPTNLYNLARSYYSERVAILHTNTQSREKCNYGMPSRIMLRPWILERAIQ